jgi:hypothetical protein
MIEKKDTTLIKRLEATIYVIKYNPDSAGPGPAQRALSAT